MGKYRSTNLSPAPAVMCSILLDGNLRRWVFSPLLVGCSRNKATRIVITQRVVLVPSLLTLIPFLALRCCHAVRRATKR